MMNIFFFFSSRRRHTRSDRDWSSDVCSSDLRTHHSQQRVHPHSQERKEDLPPVGTKKRQQVKKVFFPRTLRVALPKHFSSASFFRELPSGLSGRRAVSPALRHAPGISWR